jgi:hypothetical protein
MKILLPLTRYSSPSRRALGADALQVGAGAGLAHRDGGHQLAAGHARQPALLLGLGAISQQVVGDDAAVHVVAEALGHRAELLFADHGLVQEVAATAAVGLGNARAQQAGAAGLGPDVAVGVVLLAPACLVRHAFTGEEAPRALAQQRELVGLPAPAAHGRPPPQTSTWPLT